MSVRPSGYRVQMRLKCPDLVNVCPLQIRNSANRVADGTRSDSATQTLWADEEMLGRGQNRLLAAVQQTDSVAISRFLVLSG